MTGETYLSRTRAGNTLSTCRNPSFRLEPILDQSFLDPFHRWTVNPWSPQGQKSTKHRVLLTQTPIREDDSPS